MRSARQSLIVVRYCRLRSGAQRKADVSHPVNLPRHATQCLLPRRITAATSNASETRETRRLREIRFPRIPKLVFPFAWKGCHVGFR